MFPDLTRDDVFRLETRRLWLRWPRHADCKAILRLAGDKRVADMTASLPHPYPADEATRFVFEARKANALGRALRLAITPKAKPNQLIGMVGIEAPAGDEAEPCLGYWLGAPHWRRGLATEAARALVDAFFAYTGESRLVASARLDNVASQRVLARCGFVQAGAREKEFPARGCMLAVADFRLDRAAWRRLKPSWSEDAPRPRRKAKAGSELVATP
jgi:RimJ/RimL family protein N-acetyltransferase